MSRRLSGAGWRRSVALAATVLGVCSCKTTSPAATRVPPTSRDTPLLASLRFEGNEHFSSGDLEQGLVTEAPSHLPFTTQPHFDAVLFQGDVERILTFYRSRGYFDARVVSVDVRPHGTDGKSVDVTAHLEEGPPFTTRSVAVDGLKSLPPSLQAELKNPPALAAGVGFTQAGYEEAKSDMTLALQEASYAEAKVTGQADVIRGAHAVDVHLHVDAGRPYRNGTIDIIGNRRVSDARIFKEVGGILKTGDPYRPSVLAEAQRRVQRLGVFGNVEVSPGTPDAAAGTIAIVISVAEGNFRSIHAAGGIGIDVEHEEGHVSLGFTDRDFVGDLGRLDFDNSFALEWLPSVFEPEFGAAEPALKSTLKLTQPGFFGRGFDLESSLQGQREVEIGYDDWALRGRLAVPMRLSDVISVTASYNAELTFFNTGSTFNGLSLTPASLLQLGNPNHTGPYVLSYLEQAATVDLRDDAQEPHHGSYFQLSAQEAGGPLQGSFDDVRFLADARGYLSFGSRDVLALRGELGDLDTYGGSASPIEQRFFLGGLDSVRGYGALRLSPMVRVNTCGPAISGHSLCKGPTNSIGIVDIPVGGNGMAEGSMELRHSFTDIVGAVAFTDVGEVTPGAIVTRFNFGTLAVSPGLGLRVRTPVGAVRVDLAYLVVNPARPVSVASQTFGQQPTGYYPLPETSSGAVDNCGWPFVPQTGWHGTSAAGQAIAFAQPSACRSQFLRNLALAIAIGEAF